MKMNQTSAMKEWLKHRVIGTQYEYQSHLDNLMYLVRRHLSSERPGRLLDIGCGSGERTLLVADLFGIDRKDVYGIDNSPNSLGFRERFNYLDLDLEKGEIPFKSDFFDLVICNQVMEHLKNHEALFREMIRTVRPGGYLLVGIPNLAHLVNRFLLLFGVQPMCVSLQSSHVRGFTHKAFQEFIRSYGDLDQMGCAGAVLYPIPHFLARSLALRLPGLSGYTCYLLRKQSVGKST